MTFLITGAGGFLGLAFTKYLLNNGHTVVAIYHNNPIDIDHQNLIKIQANIFNDCEFLHQLLTMQKSKNLQIDYFAHLAWNGVAGTFRYSKETQDQNIQSVVSCIRIASELGCKKFMTVGSIMEFEASSALLYHEYPTHAPIASYCFAKLYSHGVAFNEAIKYNIDMYYPTISNAYGVGDYSNRFINGTLKKIYNNEPLSFSAATQPYDFINIRDIPEGFFKVITNGKPFKNYVLGAGECKPLKKFIYDIIEVTGYNNEVTFGAPIGFSVNPQIYDISTLIDETDFIPKVTFKEGISETYNWIKNGMPREK